ncbi:MAG: ABC transporter permease [Spirochaetes bacterium]|nr:ABC transporter permease [Spirochaetota bacterium]
MSIRNLIITAIRAIAKNKMRSSLTSIGIIIGVSSVIVMVGMGNSARIAVRDKVTTFGTNAMSVFRPSRPFDGRDVENLRRIFQVKYISPLVYESYIPVVFQNRNMLSRIYGVNKDYFLIKEMALQSGRYFTEEEIASLARVVIIGTTVWNEVFGNADPIGKTVRIKNIPFQVIGLLAEQGSAFSGRDFDNILVMPYTTASTRINNRKDFEELYIAAHNENMVEETAEVVRQYFRKKHNLPPGVPDNFRIKTSKEQLKVAENISKTLTILLAGIALISLFVGGVGIMNIMLVSVSERTREIGIRMAIGAKRKDILLQFLIESVTLSSVGGIVGIILGILIYYAIIYFLEWPFILSVFSIFISFLFAFAVGIFFGYYPAKKAADLKPIDALRYE